MKNEWLFIDTRVPRHARLAWLSLEHKPVLHRSRGRSASVLRYLLGAERARLQACAGICVVSGPGSFSSIRLGVLDANLLARLLRKPLIALDGQDADDLAIVSQKLAQGTLPTSQYVAPVYDREPNITLPRV